MAQVRGPLAPWPLPPASRLLLLNTTAGLVAAQSATPFSSYPRRDIQPTATLALDAESWHHRRH